MFSLLLALVTTHPAAAFAPFSVTTKTCFQIWSSLDGAAANRAAAQALCGEYASLVPERIGQASKKITFEGLNQCSEIRQEYICKEGI